MAEPTDSTDTRIPCPACGTKYKWKSELAGRKLKCRCGVVMRMPRDATGAATVERAPDTGIHPTAAPPPPPSPPKPEPAAAKNADDGYDLELPDLAELAPSAAAADPIARPTKAAGSSKPAGAPGRCPSCGQAVKPNAVICVGCGYNLQSGQKIQTATGDDAPAPTLAGVAGRPSTAFVRQARAAKPPPSTAVVVLKIFAFIFNGLLVFFGAFSLLKLNPCGIICFLCTGLYNIITLAKGSLEGVALVFSIICNALTMIMGLFVGVMAILFISGVLTKNPQFQQAMANQAMPPWILQVLGVVLGCVAALLFLSSLTTFATVMMSRES